MTSIDDYRPFGGENANDVDEMVTGMTRAEAIRLIDEHKNKLINPVEMLHWTWLRVTIDKISDDEWERALGKAVEVMSR